MILGFGFMGFFLILLIGFAIWLFFLVYWLYMLFIAYSSFARIQGVVQEVMLPAPETHNRRMRVRVKFEYKGVEFDKWLEEQFELTPKHKQVFGVGNLIQVDASTDYQEPKLFWKRRDNYVRQSVVILIFGTVSFCFFIKRLISDDPSGF